MSTFPEPTSATECIGIPPHLRLEAEHIALSIKCTVGEIRARALSIGDLLLQMKSKLDRGTFTKWVQSATGLNMRTAENYMLAFALTQVCPDLEGRQSFNLSALYQLARIVDSEERQATLREIVASHPSAMPAAVIAEFKAAVELPDATPRGGPATRAARAIVGPRIELSVVANVAASLGDTLPEFVQLIRDYGAVAVCDALMAIHHSEGESVSFSRGA